MHNRFVIVSGLPACGKSTLGRQVAQALDLPFVDKDRFLEALFAAAPFTGGPSRAALSRQADVAFQAESLQNAGGVLVSWWKHPASLADSGTPTEWLAALAGFRVELHCTCSPEVAVERFLTRVRHPGHGDSLRDRKQLLTQFRQQAALGPLGVGALVEMDAEAPLDPLSSSSALRQAFDLEEKQPWA